MIDNLWAGWRSEYLDDRGRREPDPDGRSVFTRILESGVDDAESHIVHRSSHVFAVLNAFPYSVGHLLVVPYRQFSELTDATADEAADLWSTVTIASRAVNDEYRPNGLNIGINLGASAGGSVRDHLHVHIVPRWTGDANFLVATAHTKTIPEPLDVTSARLTGAFRRLTSSGD